MPGIKTDDDNWDLRGHRSRVVRVDDEVLGLFAKLYDADGTPAREARLPVLHSEEFLGVLRSFETVNQLGPPGDRWGTTREWNETDRTHDGTISAQTARPSTADTMVVSGPMFTVGTPLYKEPNPGCRNNKDYSFLDLCVQPDNFLPRCNYVPAVDRGEYLRRLPEWSGRPMPDYFRHAHRRMLAPTGERTFIPTILPKGVMGTGTVFTAAFSSNAELLSFVAISSSLAVDFFVRSTGKGDARVELVQTLPFIANVPVQSVHRALRLNCLTTHYADLWQEVATQDIANDGFAKSDPRLSAWSHLTPKWSRDSALRTPYERRQALVELDALAALSLGLTVEQLQLIYRVQFPVLQQYERETYYDQRGKIVFTTNRGLSGVGLDRKQWEEVQNAPAGSQLPDWAHDAGGPFVPPFDSCDREADMAQAYHHFQERLAEGSVDDFPTLIPKVSDADAAALFICALLHASGGTAFRADLARAFALRASPDLLKRLTPPALKSELAHWVSIAESRPVKTGILASTLSALAKRNGVHTGTNGEGRATVSTSAGTPAEEGIDPWFRFEANLVVKVLRAQPEEKRGVIDESLSETDFKLLEGAG